MLVLTRKSQESIAIGGDIKIMILRIDKDEVKLGIQAPPNIPVHRQEIFEEIQRENKRAASPEEGTLEQIAGIIPRLHK